MADDLTIEILKQIRDNTAQTTQRLEHMDQRLGRVEHGLADLGKFMRQIALGLAKQERWHNEHVKLLEKDMSNVKARVSKLEKKKGA